MDPCPAGVPCLNLQDTFECDHCASKSLPILLQRFSTGFQKTLAFCYFPDFSRLFQVHALEIYHNPIIMLSLTE